MVLYTRGKRASAGEIRLATLDSGGNVASDVRVADVLGKEPKFSPDGNRIAFVRGGDHKLVTMDLDGGNQQEHTTCGGDDLPLASWRHPDKIYCAGGNKLLEHDLIGGKTASVLSSSESFRELDISENLHGVHGGMPPVFGFDLSNSWDGFAYDRCGGSISPDGNHVTNTFTNHRGFWLRKWTDQFPDVASYNTPTSREALDPQYAGNSNDHILIDIRNDGGHWNVWLFKISARKWVRITDVNTENMRSDFFRGKPQQVDPPKLTRLGLEPSSASLALGGTVELTATPKDQRGKPFAVPINWSVTGGGSMAPAASAGSVAEHTSVFTSDGTEGTFTVTAESGRVKAQVDVRVMTRPPVHLKINCGGNGYTAEGWLDDDDYVSGGSDVDFGGSWDTNATNAAPESIYQTVRHGDHTLSFDGLADGSYLIRLHFGDDEAAASRKMAYEAEGKGLVADFAPGVEAGKGFKAVVREFVVTVDDGNGLQINAQQGSGNDVFEAGIEIIEGSHTSINVDAGDDAVVGVDQSAFLMAEVSPVSVRVTWSKVSGPGDVFFADAHGTSTNATFSQPGRYELTLTAELGTTRGSDSLVVTVTDQPTLELLSPNGGESWCAGSIHTISWAAHELTDVVLSYSTDNGATWETIEDTLDTTSPHWLNYPWKIPDLPSKRTLIAIRGYKGDSPTQSKGVFEINTAGSCVRTDPARGKQGLDLSGGCSVASPHGGLLSGLLLLLALALCRLRRTSRPS